MRNHNEHNQIHEDDLNGNLLIYFSCLPFIYVNNTPEWTRDGCASNEDMFFFAKNVQIGAIRSGHLEMVYADRLLAALLSLRRSIWILILFKISNYV